MEAKLLDLSGSSTYETVTLPDREPPPDVISYLDMLFVKLSPGCYRRALATTVPFVLKPERIGPYEIQSRWYQIIDQCGGDKAAAYREVARRLRSLASYLESKRAGSFPDVFGIDLPESEDIGRNDLMEHYAVTLSHPWPG